MRTRVQIPGTHLGAGWSGGPLHPHHKGHRAKQSLESLASQPDHRKREYQVQPDAPPQHIQWMVTGENSVNLGPWHTFASIYTTVHTVT